MRRGDFVRQKDSMQCGVASLTMVCRHFGADYTPEFVADYCHATNQGVSMKGLSDAASQLGLKSFAGKLTMDQLRECPLPAIVFWNQNHFVVLHKISADGGNFYVADPGKGMTRLSRSDFESHWLNVNSEGEGKGVAMFFQPTERFGELKDDFSAHKRSFGFLAGYVGRYRRHFVLIAACLMEMQ